MYRHQFPFTAAPEGFMWQPCIYQFDQNNVPALGSLVLTPGQQTGHIPLLLDPDACFTLLAVKIENGGLNVLLFDPWSNQLMDDFVRPALYASADGAASVLEGPGVAVPAGSAFSLRLQG
jgi:hypothetical protein